MNKKVIFILVLTVIALVFLYLYSFGPLANVRNAGSLNAQSGIPTKESAVHNVTLNTYHNKDVKENYYSIKVLSDWRIGKSTIPGMYTFALPQGTAQIQLMDVPDNSTLELFVLSQEEARLKKSEIGYLKVGYQKLAINGAAAYQLTYQSTQSGQNVETVRTYITGPDRAGVMTMTLPAATFAGALPAINTTIGSFVWENL